MTAYETIDGQMRVGAKWNLLKHLLDETNTRSNQRKVLEKIVHEATRKEDVPKILDNQACSYLPSGTAGPNDYPTYKGRSCPELDAPFKTYEVREALQCLNARSAPEPDYITNKALGNLEDDSIQWLTEQINKARQTGEVPGTGK